MSIFMEFDGIKGECSDAGHKDWMDVKSINWGVSRSITSASSTQSDRESSPATIGDLTITRNMDSATPKIFIEACVGKGKDLVIHMTKTGTGKGSDVFMEYTLKNAIISGYTVEAASGDTERPEEQLKVSFIDLEVKYTPYDDEGASGASEAVGFDSATNESR